jgi:hypothetical protein
MFAAGQFLRGEQIVGRKMSQKFREEDNLYRGNVEP